MNHIKTISVRFFFQLLLLASLFCPALSSAQTVDSIPLSTLPQNTRLMIWGDSVTEIPAWYPRYIEGYLAACAGRQDVKVFTTGHSGAVLYETTSRQSDLLAFNPTMVMFLYGNNDINDNNETAAQWSGGIETAISLYQSKGIIPIVAGPGWTEGNNGNPSTPDAFEQSLLAYNGVNHADAAATGAYYSDLVDSMEISLDEAIAAYGTSYGIGEHYTPNGAILVAYEDLKTLACSGNIGTVNVNMSAGTATASSGHTVVSYSNGTVILDSSIYPFCYNYDPNNYGGTTGLASMLPYVNFSQDLNRFVLTVTNLGAPSANVTWGSQTMNFTSAQLAAGVNLTAQFTATPFDTTFAQVMAAVVNKEYFEDYETKYTSNYFGNDNGGNVDNNMIAYQAQLDAGVKALVVPVRHTISIVPQGASTAVAPVITGTMMAYPVVGQSFSYQLSALNTPNFYTATGLPAGLSMTAGGLITGTPTATGISVVSVTATNGYGTSLPTHLTLNVETPIPPAPGITSSLTATATVGVPFSYQITATNNPTNYFVVVPGTTGTEPPNSSLPPGLTYNTTTGVFSGTPTVAGTYNVELAAVNAGGVTATSESSPLVLTINPASGGAPPAPTGLTATAGSGQVSLTWSASAGATGYNIYRGTSAGGESTTPIATGVTSTSYIDTTVTNGTTYYYTVAAVNSSGTSGYSNEASAEPVSGLPPAPTGLTATGGNAQISLSWTASAGATSYNVYRGSLPNAESTTPIATGVTTTSYVDITANNGPTYYYKVAAVNSSGTSSYSNEASAMASGGSVPTAPTGLTATSGNTQVALSWSAGSGATSYNVYRGTTAGGESTTAIATGITSTSYTNTGLTNGTTYYYEVAGVNSVGTSGYSNEASATPAAGTGSTTYYQDGFSRSGDVTGSTPDVTDTGGATWSNLSGTGLYPISSGTASIAPSAYPWTAEYLPVNGTSGITLDGTKNFTLSVVVTSGPTGRTGISLNTAAPGNLFSSEFAALSTCSGFAGAYAFNGGTINYNYAAGITGPTTVSLVYNASAGTLTYTVGSTTVYTQTGVTAAEVAAIRYVAMGDDGYGGGAATPAPTFDNFTFTVGSGSGGGAPSAPTGLGATAGNAQVALSWTASSGATSYNVYAGTTAGGESTTPIATGITSTSYTNTGLTNGTAYYYKVAGVNSSGTSGYSNEASATPGGGSAPSAPTGLGATAGNAQVSLSWTASSGATSYNVYAGTTTGGESTTPIATGIASTSYTNTGLTNGTAYYYKVAAVNSSGTSGYSNEASATPAGGSGTTTYYQDSFSRSGDVTGSTPDVTDTGGATWSNSAGAGEYPISGGTASIAPSAYSWSAEYLPVNGTSGITVDGTKNFTLSVVVTSGSAGTTGISLNTAVPGNLYSSYFAALSTSSGYAGAYAFNGGTINYNFSAGITGPTTVSLAYNASAGTLTYTVGSTTVYTQTGVTAAEVSAIRYVAMGDDGYGGGAATPAPTFDNFTFTVGSGSGGGAPSAPTGLGATAGNAQVSLSWTASSGATSYNVYAGTTAGGESTTPIATGITSTSYTNTGLTNGTTYYYKVAAVNSSGTSGYSNEASATPSGGSAPPAPTGLGATAGNAQVSLSWTASSGATSYNVYRGTSAGGESTTAIATGITTTSYTNIGLTNGTAYYYKVAAVNSSGTSGYSNEASATPAAAATTYYQDSFSRSGDVTGSTPDVTDTGGATWSNLSGTGLYPISGGTASIAPSAYPWTAEYLPVNGTSGITVDGTKNFTLSVVVTSGPTGRTGISLNTAAPGNLFSSYFAALSTCSGFAGAYAFNGGTINYNYAAGITGPTTASLAYNASAGTLTYTVGSTTVYTQTGVTAAEVAAIRYVALGDDGYGGGAATPAPTFDNFTFKVGP